jgi:YgiT-type zinc finger domain-containing protein
VPFAVMRWLGKKENLILRIEGKLYLVNNVNYDECPFCGEKVLASKISQILYEKIKNKEFVEKEIRIPIIEGTY